MCRDNGRWLETECSEDSMTKSRETWAATKPVFTLAEPKSQSPRSQSTRSSEETGKPEWSKGVQEGGDAMTEPTENKPEAVPERATRDGEILLRWGWVEPRVWTERMLTALESGVKGGRWFSLIDKVHPVRTLDAAFYQVAGNKGAAGVDHVTDQRWPNAFFAKRGLYSLETAHALARQSSLR